MSQVRQTSTTSGERPTLISRECVWDVGAIVTIDVPAYASRASVIKEGETAKSIYFVFDQTVKRGSVRCHVHVRGEDPPEVRGKKITARVKVWKKTFSNGQQYLNLDFHPVEQTADGKKVEVTHRLGIIQHASDVTQAEGWTIFETLPPSKGAIVFTPPDAKLAPVRRTPPEDMLMTMVREMPDDVKAQLELARNGAFDQSPAEAIASKWGARLTKKK